MKDGSLWAAVVADTVEDTKATAGSVARFTDLGRSQVGRHLGGARTALTWRASRVMRRCFARGPSRCGRAHGQGRHCRVRGTPTWLRSQRE